MAGGTRRNRKADWARRLVRESTLTVDDLIWPLPLIDERNVRQACRRCPGVETPVGPTGAVKAAERAATLSILNDRPLSLHGPQAAGRNRVGGPEPGSLSAGGLAIKGAVTEVIRSTWRSTRTPATATTAS